jgi:hypothetical protein
MEVIMTNSNCTASPVVSKNIPYPTHISKAATYLVREETGDYAVTPLDSDPFTSEMKRYEIQSLEMATLGQIERLYKLISLLREPRPDGPPTSAQLDAYALELRKIGQQLENFLNRMVSTVVNGSSSDDKGTNQDYGVYSEDD